MKKNRTYRTNAFLAMMLAGSFLAGTTSLASESKAGSLSEAAASQQQNRTVTGKVVDASARYGRHRCNGERYLKRYSDQS